MTKEIIQTDGAPKSPAYSQAVKSGGFVFVSGQAPFDPVSGDVVGESIQEQTRQCLRNVEAILSAAGSSLDKVVRTQIEFVSETDLDAMNRIYGERFQAPLPARTSFGVAFLWKGAKVQIDCVAAVD